MIEIEKPNIATINLSEDGRNVLSNYEIIVGETGTLTINKRPITIKHQSVATGSVTYDGAERTFAAYEITSELGLAENDTLNIIYPKFSQAGTYENENNNVPDFYNYNGVSGYILCYHPQNPEVNIYEKSPLYKPFKLK